MQKNPAQNASENFSIASRDKTLAVNSMHETNHKTSRQNRNFYLHTMPVWMVRKLYISEIVKKIRTVLPLQDLHYSSL